MSWSTSSAIYWSQTTALGFTPSWTITIPDGAKPGPRHAASAGWRKTIFSPIQKKIPAITGKDLSYRDILQILFSLRSFLCGSLFCCRSLCYGSFGGRCLGLC